MKNELNITDTSKTKNRLVCIDHKLKSLLSVNANLSRLVFFFVFFKEIENSNPNGETLTASNVRAFGIGLEQAQVGAESSFSIEAHSAEYQTEDIKVVVTSNTIACSFLNSSSKNPNDMN